MEIDDYLPLSGLQHLAFCERQCALIHIERVWMENSLTLEGRHLHDKVDQAGEETREGVRVVRGLLREDGVFGMRMTQPFEDELVRTQVAGATQQRRCRSPHGADAQQFTTGRVGHLDGKFGIAIGGWGHGVIVAHREADRRAIRPMRRTCRPP